MPCFTSKTTSPTSLLFCFLSTASITSFSQSNFSRDEQICVRRYLWVRFDREAYKSEVNCYLENILKKRFIVQMKSSGKYIDV